MNPIIQFLKKNTINYFLPSPDELRVQEYTNLRVILHCYADLFLTFAVDLFSYSNINISYQLKENYLNSI